MKIRTWIILMAFLLLAGACEKENVPAYNDELPADIKRLAELNQKINSLRSKGIEHYYWGTLQKKRADSRKSFLIAAEDSVVVDSSDVYSDSSDVWVDSSDVWADSSDVWVDSSDVWVDSSDVWADSSWINEWNTCGTVESYVDEKGFQVTVLDYGEGCDEGESHLSGRQISKFKETSPGDYIWIEIFEAFTIDGYTLDGTIRTVSEGDWINDDSTAVGTGIYSTTTVELTITDDGNTCTVKGTMKEQFAFDGRYILLEGSTQITCTNGDSYSYEVLEPVVYNPACPESIVPVKGIEQWNEGDNTYIIDWGDGSCDNLATVTENGTSYTVDFGETDDEEGEPVDSSNVNP